MKVSNLEEPRAAEVKFTDGWEEFAADNRLKEGQSLVFVLKMPLSKHRLETGLTLTIAQDFHHR